MTAHAPDPSTSYPRALKSLLIALGFLFYQRTQAFQLVIETQR